MNGNTEDNNVGETLSQGFAGTRLSLIEYANSHTLDELLVQALDVVGALVDSPIGFYHFVEPDQKTLSLQQWSTRTTKEFCQADGAGLHYSVDTAGVWVDCLHQKKAVIHNDYSSLPHKKGMPEGHAKVIRELVVPVARKGEIVAILGVGNKSIDYTQQDVEIVSFLADVTWEIVTQKRADEALCRTSLDLRERVKELGCLYSISKLIEEDLALDEICQRTVDLVPSSWLYPEITCAQIRLGKRSYKTKKFIKTDWTQSKPIKVNKKRIGVIEVFLLESRPERGEGPFLQEERNLLNAIAESLGHIIEKKQAKEALQKAHDELQLRVEERTKELAAQNRQLVKEIRNRKKAEEELQKSSEKIKHFAFSVAHDLKNPANSTHGLTKILFEKYGDQLTDKGKRICQHIQQSAKDIAALVEKINIFISTKENPLYIENNSIKAILHTLVDEFSSQLNLRSVQVFISDDIPENIAGDRLSLGRIFRNLIENSLKYGGDSLSRIDIEHQLTEDLHILKVRDDGQGLTADSNDIFDWFERIADPTSIQGSGMGLAIVKEIAALHGGEVWQEPAKPNGVTFCVSISRKLQLSRISHQQR